MSTFTSLIEVPDNDLVSIFALCQRRVKADLAGGKTFSTLAEEIGVGESALKQFVHRTPGESGVRRGAAFADIYRHYFSPNHDGAIGNIKPDDLIGELLGLPANRLKTVAYGLLMAMLRIKPDHQEEASRRMFKRLYCFRNAVGGDYLVKSMLTFEQVGSEHGVPVWQFFHRYKDDSGINKTSDGVALAVKDTVYLIGDVKEGEGLDIFVVRNQIGSADFFLGFHVSVDDHRPLFSNTVLFDEALFNSQGENNGPREGVEADDDELADHTTGIVKKSDIREFGMFGDVEFGKSVLDQLEIKDAKGVLRIKTRKLQPRSFISVC